MTSIDLTPQLEEIRSKYPEYWRSQDAQREAQALWGNVPCNDAGVFETYEEVTIELQPYWTACVRIAPAPNGWYGFAVSYAYGLGGYGAAISVWNETAYTTREEALAAGISQLRRAYQRLIDCPWAPETQHTNAARMIALLDQQLSQSRQLSLF
ncbi:MAG: hypothetical protein CV089_08845 [Nitrospira sp. WS110]|nr:hypothetical protein [Nitrospira sp. WS110]